MTYARLAVLFAIVLIACSLTPTSASAQSDFFPQSSDQLMREFGFTAFNGSWWDVHREGSNGWEVHCGDCDLQFIGSKTQYMCVDYDPTRGYFEGNGAYEYARYLVNWRRMELAPGAVTAWRGQQISLYHGRCLPK